MSKDNYWERAFGERLTRRELLKGAALAGVGVAGTALVGCAGAAATPTPTKAPAVTPTAAAKAGRRRVQWPMEPIASTLEDAFKWGNEQEQTRAGRIEDLTLTADEEAKVKAMGLTIGCESAAATAIGDRCKELGVELISLIGGSSLAARKRTAKMFVNEGVDAVIASSPGSDYTYTEVVELYYQAGIPTFTTSRPATSYYPTICSITDNPYKCGAESAHILARKMAAEGFKEAQVAQISLPLGSASY